MGNNENPYSSFAQKRPDGGKFLNSLPKQPRWKEDMAFLRSFYVADDIWRFAWSLVGCLLALSWLPPPTPHTAPPG